MAWVCTDATGAIARRTWLYDALSRPPQPSYRTAHRHQTTASASSYVDTLLVGASALLDLPLVELRAAAHALVVPSITDTGRVQSTGLAGERYAIEAELARFFATQDERFGRLGVGLVQVAPAGLWYVRIGLDTGAMATPEFPWTLRVSTRYWMAVAGKMAAPNRSDSLVIRGDILSRSEWGGSVFHLGGFIGWTLRMANLSGQPPGLYENMLFSLGPIAELETGIGRFSLSANALLFIDTDIKPSGGNTNPSDLGPAVSLAWARRL